MSRDPADYVDHIRESMEYIETWIAEGREQFFGDVRTQAAVIRKLHELSESIKRLHAIVGDRYPEVPWREVIAFRDVIVHDYLGLNLDRIWDIATIHVPALTPHIARIAATFASERAERSFRTLTSPASSLSTFRRRCGAPSWETPRSPRRFTHSGGQLALAGVARDCANGASIGQCVTLCA